MSKEPKDKWACASPREICEGEKSLLEELLESPQRGMGEQAAAMPPLLGMCIDEDHPAMCGRAKIAWQLPDGTGHEAWLARIHSVTVRKGDRVIVQQLANHSEPVIMGVLDGLAPRRMAEKVPGPTIPLKQDESLRVRADDGTELMEVYQGEDGPVLRILNPDMDLELPGKLRIRAKSITLAAKEGAIELDASGNVVVKGEDISLN